MPLLTFKLLLAWLWFYVLLLSYYILKPLRDGIGSILSKDLDFWYLSTFVFIVLTMALYAWLVNRLSTKWLVFAVYQSFAMCLLLFAFTHHLWEPMPKWYAGVFFVWVSVFNLCSVALYWSVMAELYTKEEGQVWFGVLAGAGSVGALTGSGVTMQLTQFLGHQGLLFTCFLGLEITMLLAWYLLFIQKRILQSSDGELNRVLAATNPTPADMSLSKVSAHNDSKIVSATSPTLWQGFLRILGSPYMLTICFYVILGKFSATYIYNNLQSAMQSGIQLAERRTEVFAQMNFFVQMGSMVLQYLVVSWLFRTIGVGRVLAIPCLTMMAIFGTFYFESSLTALILAQVIQQIVGYGLMTPGQNLLFTIVSRQDKYVSKGFIDTVVFRFSDVLASSLCTRINLTGMPLGNLSLYLLPVLMIWFALSQRLGREFREINDKNS